MQRSQPEVGKLQLIRDFLNRNPTLAVANVVTRLGEKGIVVSQILVYAVKSKMDLRKGKDTRAESKAGAVAAAVNKADEIRQLLRTNPRLSAKDVVAALAERGIKVTMALVYFIKGKMMSRRK